MLINRFADHAGLRDRSSYQAMVTVFSQQCELVDARVQIRTKTGGACVQNPSDPDATYDGKKGPGYQVQLSETCAQANEVQLITAALAQTAVESDTNALMPVLQDLQKRELLPEEMLADTGYGSDENIQAAAKLDVEVVSPVAGRKQETTTAVATPTPECTAHDGPAKSANAVDAVDAGAAASLGTSEPALERLTCDDFAVDERTGKVTACPSGRIPLQVLYDEPTGKTTIEMAAAECRDCPYRPVCPIEEKAGSKFTTSYTDKQRRLEERRREEKTAAFAERYAKRAGLESTNSGLKRRQGLGQLRVRGKKAVFHAIYLKVAGWNLLRAAASGKLRRKMAAAMARLGLARRVLALMTFWMVCCRLWASLKAESAKS